MSRRREVATSVGTARVTVQGRAGGLSIVLGHGAGGGVESADLQAVAAAMVAAGHRVILVEQPWRVAGARVAPRPVTLDAAWLEILRSLRLRRFVVGGRSAGARVACRTAGVTGALGVIALAFPLHPPGRPESSRADELEDAGVPLLVVQGERDPFGRPDEVRAAAPRATVVTVPGADHALGRRGTAATGLEPALQCMVDFVDDVTS